MRQVQVRNPVLSLQPPRKLRTQFAIPPRAKAIYSSWKGGTQSEATARASEFEDKSRTCNRVAKCASERTPFKEFPERYNIQI